MIITEIDNCKKNKDRVNIYVDGEFAFALYLETVLQAGLGVGMDIGSLDMSKIAGEDERKYAMDAALNFLSYQMRSKKEVRDKLKLKNVSEKTAEYAIQKLEEMGYLDDRKYAAIFTEELKERMGKRGIRQKLYEKGIENEIIKETLDSLGDFAAILRPQAEKLFQKYGDPNTFKTRQKVIRTLLGRGFDLDEIKSAVTGTIEEDSQ